MRRHLHPEVDQALAAGRAVVALESTVITHGLAWPDNLETALALEAEVRAGGAVPATIAVLDGAVRIGLTGDELHRLATAASPRKCSLRDLPVALATGGEGATTVAATAFLAHQAGIAVFSTGGIGGVHRDAPFDVSADLAELGRSRICVVCAGAKSILDLPLTLERLETEGVTVLGYGTSDFPAFFTRASGLPVDARCDTVREVAAILTARRELGLPGGTLLCVPVPAEFAIPEAEAEAAIQRALAEARAAGVRGREVTPFLLARVREHSGGHSKRANVELLRNNARVAAALAVELAGPPPAANPA